LDYPFQTSNVVYQNEIIMNWKRLSVLITLVNLLGWLLIEIWSYRYADRNISVAASWLIALHLFGYYLVATLSHVPKSFDDITPLNCPGHDWQKYGHFSERCTKCMAERTI